MNTYVYAVCDESDNHIRTINANSMQNAKDKLIDIYREHYEIDEEFDNWTDFINYMYENFNMVISQSVLDSEAL